MKTTQYIRFLILLFLFSCKPPSQEKPNIVLIIADDQAWYDYGFMGHDVAQTPNLDKLALESVVFPNGHVPTAICRPSLMTLVTGLYAHQHKITGNDPRGGFNDPVYPREELLRQVDSIPTLPRILAEHGYLSHQSGKWWEGDFFRGGFTHGMTQGRRHGDEGLKIGREGMEPIFDFINHAEDENKPFFLWYAPFLPHTPHNPPDRLLDKYKDKDLPLRIAKYYAMVEWFDETCGQLLNFLEEKDMRKNTLVYYVCDNGWIQRADKNGYAPGSKQSPMEAGVRTPIMFSWPEKLKPAKRSEYLSSIDLFPTVLDAMEITAPKGLPGKSIWGNLTLEEPLDREPIFGEGYGHDMIEMENPEASLAYRWVIEGEWKLILCYDGTIEGYRIDGHDFMREAPIRLYNIKHDPHEKNNLFEDHPEKVEELKQMLEDWYIVKERKIYTEEV